MKEILTIFAPSRVNRKLTVYLFVWPCRYVNLWRVVIFSYVTVMSLYLLRVYVIRSTVSSLSFMIHVTLRWIYCDFFRLDIPVFCPIANGSSPSSSVPLETPPLLHGPEPATTMHWHVNSSESRYTTFPVQNDIHSTWSYLY